VGTSQGKEEAVKVTCSKCEVPMAKLYDVRNEKGEAVQVYLCGSCGGKVGLQDDDPPRTAKPAPEPVGIHGVDVAFPADEGAEAS
jgi:hypothetical protein